MPTRKWGSEQVVNASLPGNQSLSDVAGLTGGGFVVVWQDGQLETTDSVIRAQRYDALGNVAGGEFLVQSTTGLDQATPSVTGTANGGFFVSWAAEQSATNDDILGKVYNLNGALVREQRPTGLFETDPNQRGPDVARLGTGSVAVWVDDANSGDIKFRIFDAAGTAGPINTANALTAAVQGQPSVAASPDGDTVAIVWTSSADFNLHGRLFNAAGAQVAAEFTVNSTMRLGVYDPVVAWLNNGTFAVAWRDSGTAVSGHNDIRVRIFLANGGLVPVTGDILVNSTVFADQQAPVITALPNGGFVVSWEDTSGVGGDSSFAAVRLQAFDGAGGKIGGEFLVNTTTLASQFGPAITALADGRVAVTWTDFSSGNADIQMQIVDPRDGIVTGTGGADTLYGHDAVGDEISGGDGHDIMRGLKGNDQLYGGDGNDAGDGGHGDDSLYGSTGNDNLLGQLGDDDLFGESGSDLLNGGAGADLLHGGPGLDTASYAAGGAVNVSLDGSFAATGDAAGDVFIFVEHLQGSNAGSDILRGNGGGNTLSGLGGNDVVQGMAGNDIVYGGLGADNLSGGLHNDTFLYNALSEIGDTIQDFATIDQFLFRGTAFANLPAGTLAPTAFQASLTSGAANPNIRFIFETDQTILWFDANGSTGGGIVPVMVANLQAGATMTNADIVIF